MTEAATPSGRPRSARWATLALAALGGIALVETVASAFVYRPTLGTEDWAAAARALEAIDNDQPVWLATPWLAPLARHHLPRLGRWPNVAPPDQHGAPRFSVLGHGDDAWSAELQADLEDLPPPQRVEQQSLGALTLTTYEQPAAGTVLADFVTGWGKVQVQSDAGRCRGRGRRTCQDGRVGIATAEVDYRPRRCLKVELHEGATVRLRYPQMPTGTHLVGHAAVHDFNARLRSDAPLRMRLSVDGQRVAQWLVSDEQGWAPLAAATEAGHHDVELELTAAVAGTWQRSGYEPGRAHAYCVELRSLREEASP